MISAACLTVAVIYFLAWMRATARKSYLLISLAAASVSAVGLLELAAMHAEYPAQYARVVRWAHIPIAITAICIIGFVRVQYNAGSRRLAMAAILTRLACLPANFLTGVNLNYDSIQSLASIRFLGTYVSVAEATEPNPWMLLGSVNVLLIVVFLGHAIFQIAKRPGSSDRMRAIMVCSSILMFAAMANLWTQMLVHDHVEAPHLFAPAFLGVLLAMSYDLAGGFMLAEKLAHSLTKIKTNLSDTQRKMDQAVDAAGVGFWTWDMASDRIWLSPPACALIGVSSRETLGFADLLERLPSPDRETFLTAIGAANEQEEFHCEFRVTIAEGRYRWIYAEFAKQVNERGDGSWAVVTAKHEIESYLHKDAISMAFGFDIEVTDHPVEGKATPKVFGEAFVAHSGTGKPFKESNAKRKLAQQAFRCMTAAMLDERDPDGEVRGWFRRLGDMLV